MNAFLQSDIESQCKWMLQEIAEICSRKSIEHSEACKRVERIRRLYATVQELYMVDYLRSGVNEAQFDLLKEIEQALLTLQNKVDGWKP
jgi:hypothetical protein